MDGWWSKLSLKNKLQIPIQLIIAASAGEQSLASTGIAHNVEKIAQMSKESHAAVESNTRDIMRLEQLARELQAAASRFKV